MFLPVDQDISLGVLVSFTQWFSFIEV